MSHYLAIDIGTSAAKLALYDNQGVLQFSASEDYPADYPQPGWAEQDPADWWRGTIYMCRRMVEKVDVSTLRAVCVSGQAPSCLPVDRLGQPLRKAILWLDRRAHPQAERLKSSPALQVQGAGENTLDSYFGGLKWLWFQENEPDLYHRTWRILQASSYVIYRLTGEVVVDPSQAGLCSPFYDFNRRNWSQALCEALGFDLEKLPVIYPSEQVIGMVTQPAAEATGLPVGLSVICGGGDFACSCLGAGIFQPGMAAMMLGTAGNLLVPFPERSDPRVLNTYHVTGDRLSLGGVMAGGAVNWFVELLGMDREVAYAVLEVEAAQTPPGSDGLVFLPYLMGERTPIWDAQARGVFVGLTSRHTRGHLYRAILEGVALAFRQMLTILTSAGRPLEGLIAINGGARSQLWRQIYADVLELPVGWRPNSGGTALGAAFLAAKGVGDVERFDDIQSWLEEPIVAEPDPSRAQVYRRLYALYNGLYDKLKEDMGVLSSLDVPEGG
jgi:xylulokinase